MKSSYDEFVFFSAGPVGDHLVLLDFADKFFASTGKKSVFLMKHPNPFLSGISSPYQTHVSHLDVVGLRGVLRMSLFALSSMFKKHCYVLVFPIPPPRYLVYFAYYVRFFTRSRIVGFNLEGSKSFPIGKGYTSFLGVHNTIPMQAEPFSVSANRMLSFLGYQEIHEPPRLRYTETPSVFEKTQVMRDDYIVFHVSPSHAFRSLPADRWRAIIEEIANSTSCQLVFTGSQADIPFIEQCTEGIEKKRIVIAAGKTNAQELITLYAHAKVCVVVQTGNGLMVNMLHVPTVVVNIKGTAMFYYDFNKQATILYSAKDCVCDPFETACNMIPYKGGEYMACLFNIENKQVIDATLSKYSHAS